MKKTPLLSIMISCILENSYVIKGKLNEHLKLSFCNLRYWYLVSLVNVEVGFNYLLNWSWRSCTVNGLRSGRRNSSTATLNATTSSRWQFPAGELQMEEKTDCVYFIHYWNLSDRKTPKNCTVIIYPSEICSCVYSKKTICYRQWIEKYQWRSIFSDFLYFWQILKAALNECRYLLFFFSSSLVAAGATRCFLCWRIRKLSWFNNAQTNKLYKFSLLVQIGYYMVNVEFWLFLWNIPCSMWGADATKESL